MYSFATVTMLSSVSFFFDTPCIFSMNDTNARIRRMVCSPQIKMQNYIYSFVLHLGIRKYLDSYYILDKYFFFALVVYSVLLLC